MLQRTDTIKEVKRQPKLQNERKHLQLMYLIRDLHPEHVKNSHSLKRQLKPFKNGHRIDVSPKNGTCKDAQHYL